MTEYYLGQIFEKAYPPEAADFCNNSQGTDNPCYIEEIESLDGHRRFQIVANPQPTEEEIKQRRIQELESYLYSTDWYITRQMETGTPIPADVRVKRMAAREKISQLREQLKAQDKGD